MCIMIEEENGSVFGMKDTEPEMYKYVGMYRSRVLAGKETE